YEVSQLLTERCAVFCALVVAGKENAEVGAIRMILLVSRDQARVGSIELDEEGLCIGGNGAVQATCQRESGPFSFSPCPQKKRLSP
ncbi:MAG: hypothetical protein ACI97A_002543, partial [Planctomycetota bacterium]